MLIILNIVGYEVSHLRAGRPAVFNGIPYEIGGVRRQEGWINLPLVIF